MYIYNNIHVRSTKEYGVYVCIGQVPLKHKVHIHLNVQQHVHCTENGRRGTESKHKLKEKYYYKHKGREEWKNIRLTTKQQSTQS